MPNPEDKIVKAIDQLARRVDALDKTITTVSKPPRFRQSEHPTETSELMLRGVNLDLDWINPGIKTKLYFTRLSNGSIRIAANISGEDASIVEDLLDSMDVHNVTMSVMVVNGD